MSARQEILARIRKQLAFNPRARAAALDTSGVLPIGMVRSAPSLRELFLQKLPASLTSHSRIAAAEELPAHVAQLLAARSLPTRLVLAPEPALAGLGWAGVGIAIEGALQPLQPMTVVSCAAAGIAETGSLVFSTAEASRPTHNLLAELHIVVLSERKIVPTPEAAWRMATAPGVPRGLVFITGPSRTGDIEMTLEIGVHGATALHVVLAPDPAFG